MKNPLNPLHPMFIKKTTDDAKDTEKDNHRMNQMNRMKGGEQQITLTARKISVISEIRC